MSIISAPFLFLFLPAVIGVYYLIPRKTSLRLRNHFLLLASLFFYLWAEHIFIVLLLGMVFLTWIFGKMAYGRRRTKIGKTAVFLTVLTNLTVLLIFGRLEFILDVLGQWFGKDFSYLLTTLPVGFSFFIFSSISYVVDIYRGQSKISGSLFQTALYTCAFFKILQGPIISYRKFEMQISDRTESFDFVAEGIWRFSLGFCKKIIIADTLSYIVQGILSSDFSSLPLGDAWLGCIAFLVYLYFDFSGYSDMAIGLAKVFGFSIPENFNYPYLSKSVSEYWRRWHITLCVWFTEYLYYPILLGPSVRLRKFLLRHNVRARTAKTVQNIFVPACVWLVTALWHGMNLNYTIWGMANCTGMLIDPHIKPIKNKRVNTAVRRAGMLLFLFLSMPLISIDSFRDSLLFYRAMFTGSTIFSDLGLYYIQTFWVFLFIGILGCFPVVPQIKEKFVQSGGTKRQRIWDICAGILLVILVFISMTYVYTRDTVVFLYQQ